MAYDYPGKGFHENSPGQMVRGKFWVPTAQQLEQATEWMKNGGTVTSLAKLFGMSKQTLYKKMKSTDERLCDEHGQNVLRVAVDMGQAWQADFVEGKWWKIIRNEEHKNHYAAIKDWRLHVMEKKEPEVIIINEGGQKVDKSPQEIAELLKKARRDGQVLKAVGD